MPVRPLPVAMPVPVLVVPALLPPAALTVATAPLAVLLREGLAVPVALVDVLPDLQPSP